MHTATYLGARAQHVPASAGVLASVSACVANSFFMREPFAPTPSPGRGFFLASTMDCTNHFGLVTRGGPQ